MFNGSELSVFNVQISLELLHNYTIVALQANELVKEKREINHQRNRWEIKDKN